jgi:FkbM family methyltransferase
MGQQVETTLRPANPPLARHAVWRWRPAMYIGNGMFPAPQAFQHVEPLRRLARGIWKRYARAFKPPFFVEKRLGAYWLLDQFNIIDRNLFCFGTWEREQIKRIRQLSKIVSKGSERPMFLDIGSHAGFYAVVMAQSGDFGRVLAFEPVPRHLAMLSANLLLNDLIGTVDVFPVALSDKAATLRFAQGPATNRGMAHTIDGLSTGLLSQTPQDQIIEVRAERLDDLMDVRGAAACVKIDVEGHEQATLTGMLQFLQNNTCALQVELLPEAVARVSELLQSNGYRPLGNIGFDHYFHNVS